MEAAVELSARIISRRDLLTSALQEQGIAHFQRPADPSYPTTTRTGFGAAKNVSSAEIYDDESTAAALFQALVARMRRSYLAPRSQAQECIALDKSQGDILLWRSPVFRQRYVEQCSILFLVVAG